MQKFQNKVPEILLVELVVIIKREVQYNLLNMKTTKILMGQKEKNQIKSQRNLQHHLLMKM